MQTFSNQRSYNDHVDNVIAGPLTPPRDPGADSRRRPVH